jgi:hypothetical protein
MSHDTIEAYLDSVHVSDAEIEAAGGLFAYLETQCTSRPQVTQFQVDVLSAPR